MAEKLLDYWRSGIGQKRGEWEDGATPILHQSRALVVARGLQKILLDACVFSAPASCAPLRAEALAASARLLVSPAADEAAHRAAVAETVHLSADELQERLYADLPDNEVLAEVPAWTVPQLIARYNLELCQGLLLGARELVISLHDTDVGLRRQLLKALRFRRLLAEVRTDGGSLTLTVSGPDAVLDQASRYGLQLALFLPALCCAGHWTARAEVRVPRRDGPGTHATLELSDDTGLVGDSQFLRYLPEGLRDLTTSLAAKCPGWRIEDGPLSPLPSGELVAPDLRITTSRGPVDVELFHRWHGMALAKRLDQLDQGLMPHLALGVDRHLARTKAIAPLLKRPIFTATSLPPAPSPRWWNGCWPADQACAASAAAMSPATASALRPWISCRDSIHTVRPSLINARLGLDGGTWPK